MSGPVALFDALGVQAVAHPEWLLLLLPLAAGASELRRRRAARAIAWPGIAEARRAGARRFDAVGLAALALRAAALVALAIVLAGPVGVHPAPPEPGFGLDIVLAVDASGSMRAVDTEVSGARRTRLALARRVVARFAEERAAEGDRVGLVLFGESAFTACPLTGDGRLLAASLDRIEAGVAGEATALGDALALAVKRLAVAGAPTGAGGLVVLLTDGRNNAGRVSPETATALAGASGVRVHTVAIGTAGAEVPVAGSGGLGLRLERHDVDSDALEAIAAATAGRFFAASNSEQLAAVYQEIDALERVARELPPRTRRSARPEPLLALAGGFLLAEMATARVLRRRLP